MASYLSHLSKACDKLIQGDLIKMLLQADSEDLSVLGDYLNDHQNPLKLVISDTETLSIRGATLAAIQRIRAVQITMM